MYIVMHKSRVPFVQTSEFCKAAANINGSSFCKLIHATLLKPRILENI